jgi:hypothetical protein
LMLFMIMHHIISLQHSASNTLSAFMPLVLDP